jgi:hypothetical protein
MASFLELSCDQGTDFTVNLDLTNDDGSTINVTNYTFSSSIRKSYYSSNVTANLTVTVANAASGNVVLSMNAATTANIRAGRYLYDIKMVRADSTKSRVVEGIITVFPQITQ